MKSLTAIPFFRILIPFVIGILIALMFQIAVPVWFVVPLFFFWVYLFLFLGRNLKHHWLLVSDVMLCIYGILLFDATDIRKQENFYGNYSCNDSLQTIIAQVNDIPLYKEKTVKCELRLLQIKTNRGYQPVVGTIVAYFKKPVSLNLDGTEKTLILKSRLVPVPLPKNPHEFNYGSYLANKQIYNLAFVEPGCYSIVEEATNLKSIWQFGLGIKSEILKRFKNSALSPQAYAMCSALLTGYDDDIDASTIDAFAHSGTLHVLSVSGLHTGVIYLVLNFLFNLIDRQKKWKLTRFIFLTVALWVFALITGFSAPVLRAVMMFNLFGLGKIFLRHSRNNQTNILLASAFLMLSFEPRLINDLGFLLSYFALFGLIYFQPILASNFEPRNFIQKYLWQSITASLASTISTLPITLFYFKQFPIWFIVCNIVVVPVTFLLLILALFVVLKIGFVTVLINGCVYVLTRFINVFNVEGLGYIDRINFNLADLCFLTLLIVLATYLINNHTYKATVLFLLILISWQGFSIVAAYGSKSDSFITVYNINGKSRVLVKNKTSTYLNGFDKASFNYSIRSHLTSFNSQFLDTNYFNAVEQVGITILILNKTGSQPRTNFEQVKGLVITDNFNITEGIVSQFPNLKWVVTDASNNNYTTRKAAELSSKFGLTFYNTKERGALILALK